VSARGPEGAGAILLAALLWSSGGLFIKLAPGGGLLVAGGRALVTGVFYLLAFRALRGARLSSAVVYAGMILTFVTATKWTTAANAILLQYTGTAWVLALGPLLLGERVRRADVLTVLACLGGVGLCLLDAAPTPGLAATAAWGNALGVLSGLFFAGTIVAMRRDALEGRALASTTAGNLLAAAVALPLAHGDWPELADPVGVATLLWLGVVQMGIAYVLFQRGLRTVPASRAGVLALLEPALSPLWVWLGTGERAGPWTLAGGAVVVCALLASGMGARDASPAPE
jgi:DME family drug/metabolite transporter